MNYPQCLEINNALEEQWYHSIELLPGQFTDGYDHANIALTRMLLRGCEIENMNCLDIGAQDFLITLLLLRRRAKTVVAYDILDKLRRANLLKKIFNVDFDYVHGVRLSKLPSIFSELGLSPFDVVIFSGVLYHLFDPLASLSIIRGLVRNGGLLLIETAAIVDETMAMYFNADGRFYPHGNYWQISVECLDYLLRFLKLAPLDCVHLGRPTNENRGHPTNKSGCRVGIVCRAVDHCIPCENDQWMSQEVFNRNFAEFLDWKHVMTCNSPVVIYSIQNGSLVLRQDTKTINIFKTIHNSCSIVINDFNKQVRLKLDAKW